VYKFGCGIRIECILDKSRPEVIIYVSTEKSFFMTEKNGKPGNEGNDPSSQGQSRFCGPTTNCLLLITYLFNPEDRKETFRHFT